MSNRKTKVYEGLITETTTPIAFNLAERMAQANRDFSNKPDAEKSGQAFADHLVNQNRELLRAIGDLETELGIVSGRIARR